VYTRLPAFVIGFHGCDQSVGERIIAGKMPMRRSENDYDWLGHGFYFWEGNYTRAKEWAKRQAKTPRKGGPTIRRPFALGAVIDLGHCLNLLEQAPLTLVKQSHQALAAELARVGLPVPTNRPIGTSQDLILRHLDCAVIEFLHQNNKANHGTPYDSVRAMFVEGEPLYAGAGFHAKSHIQICVRDERCIKGFFRPRIDPVNVESAS